MSYLHFIGLSFTHNGNRMPKQLSLVKSNIAKGFKKDFDDAFIEESDCKSLKLDSCIAFIKFYICDMY